MADMSQVNLERLRATDADWNESDHPRANNGRFTSGSGSVSAMGGGGKFSKPTQSMTAGKFKKPNEEASKVIAEGAKNKEKPQAIISKANRELAKGEAARKTLNRSKGKINAMRSLAEAATPYHAESQQASVDKFKNVEQMLKKVDKVAASYAGKLAKAAEKGGESAAMAAAEKLNAYIDKQDASDFVKGYHRGRLQLALREYNKGGLKQRKDKMEAELKAKAAGSGESHAKALESLAKDFKNDYFISSYAKDLAKAAREGGEAGITKRAEELASEIEKSSNPGFTKSVQNNRLEYVLNQYKSKMPKQSEQPSQPAQGTGWNRKRTIEFLNKEVLPQLKPGENFEHSDIPNMISMVEKFRRENNATELHPKVENGFLSINGIKVGRIASTAPKGNYGGGHSTGMARAEGRILARQEEDV